MKGKKKLFAVLLSALMVVAMMPGMVFADGEDVEIVKAIAQSADINITKGNVSPGKALSGGSSASFGVYALADNGHTATVNVKDVSVSVNNTFVIGIAAYAGDPTDKTSGHVNVTAGNVASRETGVDVNVSEKSDAAVTINGDVTAGAYDNDYGTGVMVQSRDGSLAEATVNGNVSAKDKGVFVTATTEAPQAPATANVKVYGDVTTTGQDGIVFQGKTNTQDVLVTGTVKSNKYGIDTDTYYWPNMGTNNGLTVWKIETVSGNAEDLFVKRVDDSAYEPDGDSAKAANYIVRAADNVKALKSDGSALATSHDLPVAREGEKVLITAKNGNVVTKAYSNGEEITTKDDRGFFYVEVPRGGGINITAEIGDTPAPTPGPTKITVPTGKTLTYTGSAQTGVEAGTGYTLTGTTTATEEGSYSATAKLEDGYEWADGTTADKVINWKINAAPTPTPTPTPAAKVDLSKATLSVNKASFTYNGKVQRPTKITVKVNNTTLKLGTDYTLKYSNTKSEAAGKYKVTVTGKGDYTGSKTKTYTIKKAANTMVVKGLKPAVSASALKNNAKTIKRAKALSVKKAKGKVTYKKAKGDKKITVNKRNGNITLKKGLKAKTYTVKVTVTAKGNNNYKKITKTVNVKISVK